MSTNSGIEWTEATWNPLAGCSPISPGCLNCYAATMSHRLEAMGQKKYRGLTVLNNEIRTFNGVVRFDKNAITLPHEWRAPRNIFVNSMSDLFHEDVSFDVIAQIVGVMIAVNRHRYQVLTKRTARMLEFLQEWKNLFATPAPVPHIWWGTSIENQRAMNVRAIVMEKIARLGHFTWFSMEPLLEEVHFPASMYWDDDTPKSCWLDWCVVGGESGGSKKSPARPCSIDWIRTIVTQCKTAGVPVFVKQLGSKPTCHYGLSDFVESGVMFATSDQIVRDAQGLTPLSSVGQIVKDRKGGDINEFPEDLRVREMPTTAERR